MGIRFLSRGPLDQVSGGYVYNRYLIDYLRRAGAVVEYHEDIASLTEVDATDTVVVDSLVVAEAAPRLLALPARLVLLLHVAPAVDHAGALSGRMLRALYERSRLIVTGDETLRIVRDVLGVDSEDVVKIEPGVPEHWRSKTRYAARARSLLCVSNYVPGKGIDRLLGVLSNLQDLSWRLTLHGNDELDPGYFARILRMAGAYRVQERLDLAGPVPHDSINRAMLEADLLVHFSEHESYSMVTAEAIASGLPVLSYRTGNCVGFSRSGLVRYLQPGDGAKTLRALIEDERAYGELRPTGSWRVRTCQDVGREFLAWWERENV